MQSSNLQHLFPYLLLLLQAVILPAVLLVLLLMMIDDGERIVKVSLEVMKNVK
jgi:hypothetical protein